MSTTKTIKKPEWIQVGSTTGKLPGGMKGKKIIGLKVGINISKILNYIKNKKHKKV